MEGPGQEPVNAVYYKDDGDQARSRRDRTRSHETAAGLRAMTARRARRLLSQRTCAALCTPHYRL